MGSPAFILVEDFNFSDDHWKYKIVEREQSQRFLECVDDIFLIQLVRWPAREGTLLDLLLMTREGLVGEVMVGSHLGHIDPGRVEFLVVGEVTQVHIR